MPLTVREQAIARQLELEANKIAGAMLRHPTIEALLIGEPEQTPDPNRSLTLQPGNSPHHESWD